jgi:hypothetical protein
VFVCYAVSFAVNGQAEALMFFWKYGIEVEARASASSHGKLSTQKATVPLYLAVGVETDLTHLPSSVLLHVHTANASVGAGATSIFTF